MDEKRDDARGETMGGRKIQPIDHNPMDDSRGGVEEARHICWSCGSVVECK